MYTDPEAWHRARRPARRHRRRLPARAGGGGAQALQIFDSWIGALDAGDYREYVLPHVRAPSRACEARACPSSTSAPGPSISSRCSARRAGTSSVSTGARRSTRDGRGWARAWASRATSIRHSCSVRASACSRAWTTYSGRAARRARPHLQPRARDPARHAGRERQGRRRSRARGSASRRPRHEGRPPPRARHAGVARRYAGVPHARARGRPPSPELIEEMRGNYGAIGGRSPLTEITLAQARRARLHPRRNARVRRHAQLAARYHRGRDRGGGRRPE